MVNGLRGARLGRRRHRGGGRDARPADVDAVAGSDRLQGHGQTEGRHHGDRPRAHGDADAARQGRGRQIRRVLRPRPRQPRAGRSRHHRQHGARIRRDLRLLPDRRRDAALPHRDRTAGRARRAGRSLREGAGHVPREGFTRSGVHRFALARSVLGRALDRRPEASAGSRAAARCRRRFCGRDGEGIQQGGRARQARAGRRPQARPRPRRCGDRGDHLMHQHVEPQPHAGRRHAGAQCGGQGPQGQAVGENFARAGITGGRRIFRQVGTAEGSRRARLQSRRLRLHHLHRQFRPAARGDFRRDQQARSGRLLGAVRQS